MASVNRKQPGESTGPMFAGPTPQAIAPTASGCRPVAVTAIVWLPSLPTGVNVTVNCAPPQPSPAGVAFQDWAVTEANENASASAARAKSVERMRSLFREARGGASRERRADLNDGTRGAPPRCRAASRFELLWRDGASRSSGPPGGRRRRPCRRHRARARARRGRTRATVRAADRRAGRAAAARGAADRGHGVDPRRRVLDGQPERRRRRAAAPRRDERLLARRDGGHERAL